MENTAEEVSKVLTEEPTFIYSLGNKLMYLVYSMVCYAGAFAIFTTSMVYFRQDSMLYHPAVPEEKYRYVENMPPGYREPKEHGMEYESVTIETKDKVKIHGWFIKANANPSFCRTLLFFHGNAGNIGSRLPNIVILVKRLNCNVLIIDYRGYGYSEGTPSEEGLKLDGEATLEYALNREDVNKNRIFVFGRSLGGAVAA